MISGVAASETEGAQTGARALRGSDDKRDRQSQRKGLGSPAREGESPVGEGRGGAVGSRVPRDTRNLVGTRGDHPVRLNTTW